MKAFFYKFFVFFSIVILVCSIGLSLPFSKLEKESLFYVKLKKDSILKKTPSPRIIFIGGSNLSFGLNSKLVKDSLNFNPINTGIHAAIGLEYMIKESLPHVRKGDIIILAPEYSNYFGDFMYGDMELMELVKLDFFNNISKLSFFQIANTVEFIIPIAFKRYLSLLKSSFISNKKKADDLYSPRAFNEYGDVYIHWGMEKIEYEPYEKINYSFNENSISKIIDFNKNLIEKEAKLFVTFPGFQDMSYDNSDKKIKKVESALKKTNLSILGKTSDYRIDDSLTFNTPYHLSKNGVDYRTKLFIKHFKNFKENKK